MSEAAPLATISPAHVRDALTVPRAMRWLALALTPAVAMALYNTGWQANAALSLSEAVAPGWRGMILATFSDGGPGTWAALVHGALWFVPVLAVSASVSIGWVWLFARARKREPGPGALVTALIFALMLPPAVPLWMAALGMSFGIVFAREIFGGFGRNFLHPVIAALVFLYVTYPAQLAGPGVWVATGGLDFAVPLSLATGGGLDALAEADVTWGDAFLGRVPGAFGQTSALACLLGGAVLLWSGTISWRVLAGIAAGGVAAALLLGGATGPAAMLPWQWHFVLGGFAFGAIFVATDPVTSAMTDGGRWAYGIVVGGLAIFIRVVNPVVPEGMLFAILLGSVLAPSFDAIAIWLNTRRRARRAGLQR